MTLHTNKTSVWVNLFLQDIFLDILDFKCEENNRLVVFDIINFFKSNLIKKRQMR